MFSVINNRKISRQSVNVCLTEAIQALAKSIANVGTVQSDEYWHWQLSILFFVNYLAKSIKNLQCGFGINAFILSLLLYADDIAPDTQSLQHMLNCVVSLQ